MLDVALSFLLSLTFTVLIVAIDLMISCSKELLATLITTHFKTFYTDIVQETMWITFIAVPFTDNTTRSPLANFRACILLKQSFSRVLFEKYPGCFSWMQSCCTK